MTTGDTEINTSFKAMVGKQETPKVGVGVVVRHKGQVLFGLRRGSHGAGHWSLPGGHQNVGEPVRDCCARELYEETSIRISPNSLKPMGWSDNIMAEEGLHYITVYMQVYLHPGEVEVVNREPDKCERWEWFDSLPATPWMYPDGIFES